MLFLISIRIRNHLTNSPIPNFHEHTIYPIDSSTGPRHRSCAEARAAVVGWPAEVEVELASVVCSPRLEDDRTPADCHRTYCCLPPSRPFPSYGSAAVKGDALRGAGLIKREQKNTINTIEIIAPESNVQEQYVLSQNTGTVTWFEFLSLWIGRNVAEKWRWLLLLY